MRQFEKNRFIKELENDGVETVRKNVMSGKYGSEYLKIARSWIKEKNYEETSLIQRKRVLIAIVAVSIAALTLIVTLLIN